MYKLAGINIIALKINSPKHPKRLMRNSVKAKGHQDGADKWVDSTTDSVGRKTKRTHHEIHLRLIGAPRMVYCASLKLDEKPPSD